MNYNGKDLWLFEQQNMQTFFMENYKMQFRDFEQKEKDGLKYIIVKHQFFPNRVIDVMQCWEKKMQNSLFKLRNGFYDFHNSAKGAGRRRVQSGGLLCRKPGVTTKMTQGQTRTPWLRAEPTQRTGGWLMAMVSQAAGNDVFSVNGWVNWGCWWTKINLVISTSYAKFISRGINLNVKERHSRRVSQWPVAALTTQENPALVFTFRLELIKTPGAFAEDWPGRHIDRTQISKASKAMRK